MHPAKVNTINTLQLIADIEAQKSYEANVPIADVPAELVNQWFDDFYHPDSDWYKEPFTNNELDVLGEFHAFYDARVSSLPDSLDEMHQCYQWIEVVGKAQWALNMLNWQGVVATYDNS